MTMTPESVPVAAPFTLEFTTLNFKGGVLQLDVSNLYVNAAEPLCWLSVDHPATEEVKISPVASK